MHFSDNSLFPVGGDTRAHYAASLTLAPQYYASHPTKTMHIPTQECLTGARPVVNKAADTASSKKVAISTNMLHKVTMDS